jgi:hypothetical protein
MGIKHSLSTVKKWRKRFINERITLEDDPRSGRPLQSDSCESLRALINETSYISDKSMYQKLRISKATYLHILHEDLGFRKCSLSWVRHSMTENEAHCRVTFFKKLLQVMRHARETNFKHFSTGDELWF